MLLHGELVLGFLQTSLHVLFPFANFALYPSAVINLSCEYKYLLSPVSSSELLNLEEVLENPNTGRNVFSSVLQNILILRESGSSFLVC